MKGNRDIRRTKEFDEFYFSLSERVQMKYDYVMDIIKKQNIVSEKFVKRLVGTELYEVRVAVSSNQYRTLLVAIDADSFMESTRVLLLNSFLKKDTKQYRKEIRRGLEIFNRWREMYDEDK